MTVLTPVKQFALLVYGLFIRVKVVGRIEVPLRRSFIVAANHLNGVDSIVIQIALRTRLFFATSVRWFAGRFSRYVMRNLCDAVPVEPDDPLASAGGVRECLETLRLGGSIGIFPEGQFNRTSRVGRLHDGTAYLAARTGVPILPVYIRNLRLGVEIDDSNRRRECWTGFLSVVENLLNTHVQVVVGDPIVPSTGPPHGRDELRTEVARLNRELRLKFDELARTGAVSAS